VLALFLWRNDGVVIEANDAFLNLLGKTRSELSVGSISWAESTPPEFRALDARALEELSSCGSFKPYEKEFVRRDGSRVPVLVGGNFLPGLTGTGIAFAVDLSPQRLNQQIRDQNLARLRKLVASSAALLAERSLEGLYRKLEEVSCALTGASHGVAGRSFRGGTFHLASLSFPATEMQQAPDPSTSLRQSGISMRLLEEHPSVRYSREELETPSAWWGLPEGHAPLRGLLAARLTNREGQTCGLIMVSNKTGGDFTAEDHSPKPLLPVCHRP
jgi:PAS domain S-box-containing protein